MKHFLRVCCLVPTFLMAFGISSAGNRTWTTKGPDLQEDIHSLVVNPDQPDTVFICTYDSNVMMFNQYSWSTRNSGIMTFNSKCLAIDESNPSVMYLFGRSGEGSPPTCYRTNNNGEYWLYRATLEGSGFDDPVSTLVNREESGYVYISILGKGVYYSTDSGKNWTKASMNPSNQFVNCLTAHPTDGSVLYAGSDTGFYKSTDYGFSWTRTGNVNDLQINSIAIKPDDPSIMYIAVDNFGSTKGVYASTNGGDSWPLKTDLNKYAVDLVIDPEDTGRIFCGTSGQGIWLTEDNGYTWVDASEGLPDNSRSTSMDLASFGPGDLTVYLGLSDGFVYSYTISTDDEAPEISTTTKPEGIVIEEGPYYVEAEITDNVGIDTSMVFVNYSADSWVHSYSARLYSDGGDTYGGYIPVMYFSNNLDFFVSAFDLSGLEGTDPPEGEYYTFTALLPPNDLEADDDDSLRVDLSWKSPFEHDAHEISYDDGTAESIIWWTGGGAGWSVSFEMPYYPAKIVGATFLLGQESGALSTKVTAKLYDDDGSQGSPGSTIIGPDTIDVDPGTWVTVDYSGENIIVDEGEIFFGFLQTEADQPQMTFDTDPPNDKRSWGYNGSYWEEIYKMQPPINSDLIIHLLVEPYDYTAGDRRVNHTHCDILSDEPIKTGPYTTERLECTTPFSGAGAKSPNSLDILEYLVYRKETVGGLFAVIDSVDGGTTDYEDTDIVPRTMYYYTTTAKYAEGYSGFSNEAAACPGGAGVSGSDIPSYESVMVQNYPNPFNPQTTITFTITGVPDAESLVHLAVFNVAGQEVKVLVDDRLSAGRHSVVWDGSTNSGDKAASGVYFYRLKFGNEKITRQMVMLK